MKTNKTPVIILLAALVIAGVAWVSYSAGRKSNPSTPQLMRNNKIYTDPDAQGMEEDARDDINPIPKL